MRQLLRRVLLGVVWIGAVMAVVGFMQPWATLDLKSPKLPGQLKEISDATSLSSVMRKLTKGMGKVVVQVKRGAETVTGELPDLSNIPNEIRGIDVPRLANRQDAYAVVALAEMFTGERELGLKSYAVYLLPGLALLCALTVTLSAQLRPLVIVIGLICLAIAAGGSWKLATTNTDALLVAITIGHGLWLSMWAYVVLGCASLAVALIAGRRR